MRLLTLPMENRLLENKFHRWAVQLSGESNESVIAIPTESGEAITIAKNM
jgi:hypothetical protein